MSDRAGSLLMAVGRARALLVGLAVASLLTGLAVLVPVSPALAFPDVPAGHAYETAIQQLASRGIIGGYTNGDFGLNDPVKRAQFAKMIVGALSITPSATTVTRFTDLGSPDASGYPHKFVQTAYDNGITYGTDSTQTLFDPWRSISRQQVVSMIVRGAQNLHPASLAAPAAGTASLFTSVPEPHGQNLRVAEYNHLLDGLQGLGAGWNPAATATRGEVAQMLWNLLQMLNGGGTAGNEVWVRSDGSGDYASLRAAVAAVAPGTTIHLGPGTFTLDATLVTSSSISLVGSGSTGGAVTTISCPGTILSIYDATLSATGIRFVTTGGGSGIDVVDAERCDVIMDDCYFAGDGVSHSGYGLYVGGASSATIRHCTFEHNGGHGLALNGDIKFQVENNVCSHNGQSGIAIWSSANGLVSGNTCSNNSESGMLLALDGVYTARSNTCNANSAEGIACSGSANVTAQNNTLLHNTHAGIMFGDHSRGSAHGNECAFGQYGIVVGETATPVIGANNLHDNTENLVHF
jgi:parallel beta-helix repeat protein